MHESEMPAEILKACLVLGIDSDAITEVRVRAAWKNQLGAMARIGDKESAAKLDASKKTLIKWLRKYSEVMPRRKCDHCGIWLLPDEPDHDCKVPRQPLPVAGAGEIALMEP